MCSCLMCSFGVQSHCLNPEVRARWREREHDARLSLLRFIAGDTSNARDVSGQPKTDHGGNMQTKEQLEEFAWNTVDSTFALSEAIADVERHCEALTKAQQDLGSALEELGARARKCGALMVECPEVPEPGLKAKALAEVDAWITAALQCRAHLGTASMSIAEMAILLEAAEAKRHDRQPLPLREILDMVKK